jgi:hypothetical protein
MCCILAATTALADPPAPRGWSRAERPSHTLYTPEANRLVELRLYSADDDAQPARSWLEARIRRGVPGLGAIEYDDIRPTGSKAFMAIGRTGTGANARFVMASACARADGAKRYAELILPQNVALLKVFSEPAGVVLAQACLEAPQAVTGTPAR